MCSFKELCERFFGSKNLYEVLRIQKDASEKEIRKAYHKLSLICHPDRVDESKKAEATEKFKVLGKVHSVLSDSEKRSIYDETGIYDLQDDQENLDSNNWLEYWRKLFQKITIQDIQKYEKEYKGSDEELNDLKKAYEQWKGDMDYIYESVPFLSLNEENRIRARIHELIDSGTVTSYDIFVNEPQAKRDRRVRKLKKEEKEAEKLKKKHEQEEGSEDDGENALANAILNRRQAATGAFLDSLEKKYSKPGKNKGSRSRKTK